METSEKNLKDEDTKEKAEKVAKSEKEKQMGNDYLRAKDYEMALQSYTKAIDLNPQNSAAYFNRALVLLKLKKFKKAAEDCDKAIIIKNDYTKAYHRRAKAYIELKEYEKAVPDLEKVLEKEQENEEANLELKKCRDEMATITGYRRIQIEEVEDEDEEEGKKDDPAEDKNDEIIEEKPQEPVEEKPQEIIEVKPQEKFEKKFHEVKEEEAVEIILENQNTEEFIKNIEYIKLTGNNFFKKEDYDQAIVEFTKGIMSIEKAYDEAKLLLNTQLLVLSIALYNNRALSHSKLDCNNEAIHDSLHVLKLDNNNAKALYRIARCEACRGNFKEAYKNMKLLLEIEPNNEVAKKDLEDYKKKINEAKIAEEVKIVMKSPKIIPAEDPESSNSDSGHVNYERRVSFRESESNDLQRKPSIKKDSFKKLEAKYPKGPIDLNEDDDELKSDEEIDVQVKEEKEENPNDKKQLIEEITKVEVKRELKIEDKEEKKKQKSVEISQETINNAKTLASKMTSNIPLPKSYLMFEAAAKDLKSDKAAFLDYLKVLDI